MKNYLSRLSNNNGFNPLSIFDDGFVDFFRPVFGELSADGMKTDIRETDDDFRLEIEMPGFDKSDINLSFEDGYVIVKAEKTAKEESGNKKERFIRQERSVSCSRSYYVGENVSEQDVKAKYENGVLSIILPKNEQLPPPSRKINIE